MALDAPVIPCRGCGAPLAVDPEAATASCPRCRNVTPVPDALRQRAREYRRSLGIERGRVESARRSMSDTFAKLGKYFGPPLTLIIVAHVIAVMVIDPSYQEYETWGFFGAMGVLGLFFFAWLGMGIRAEMRAGDEVPAGPGDAARPGAPPPVVFEGSVPAPCSSCGGQVRFVIEQPSTRCPYCNATVYPTPAVQQALLVVVAQKADLEVARTTRAHVRQLAATFDRGAFDVAMSATRWMGLLAMPASLVFVGALLALHDGQLNLDALEPLDVIGLILAGAGLLLLLLIVGIAWLVRRLSRPRAIRRALDAVAAGSGGQPTPGLTPVLDWLDAQWAAEVPAEVLTLERSDGGKPIVRLSLALAAAGGPALLAVAHAPHVRRTDLFLARHARRAQGQGHMTRAAGELRAAGWALLVTNGGAHVMRLDSDPRALTPPTVAWLLDRAAQVAWA